MTAGERMDLRFVFESLAMIFMAFGRTPRVCVQLLF